MKKMRESMEVLFRVSRIPPRGGWRTIGLKLLINRQKSPHYMPPFGRVKDRKKLRRLEVTCWHRRGGSSLYTARPKGKNYHSTNVTIAIRDNRFRENS